MISLFSKETITYKKKLIFNAGVESVKAYIDAETNYSPQIQLLFSPFGLPFVPLEILGTNINQIIRSLEWTKDRNNPGGICTVTFVPDAEMIKRIVKTIDKFSGNMYSRIWGGLGVEVEDLLKPMTTCQLWIDGYHIFTGYVRGCSRSASVGQKEKDVSYTVTIEELGNIYNQNTLSLDYIIKDAMATNLIDSIYESMDLVSNLKYIPLSMGLKALVNAFKLTFFSQGVSLSDGLPMALRLRAESNPLGGISNLGITSALTTDIALFQMHSSGGGQQSFWDFMKNLVPSPWTEFYTESGGRTMATDQFGTPSLLFPGANYIVARTTPYSNPLIGIPSPATYAQTLPFELTALQMIIYGDFVIITDKMIQNKSLGFDSVDQKTIFHTYYSQTGMNAAAKGIKSVGPLNPFSSGGIKTFGPREMFETIDCTNFKSAGTVESYSEKIAKKITGLPGSITENALSNLLCVWFRNQSRFREGSVTVKGMPWARAGMYCLYLPEWDSGRVENIRDIGMYYIDTVTHSYDLSNTDVNFTTTLSLIRGTPMPMSIAQTALLLFDWELLPPESGLFDGEYAIKKAIRDAIVTL
jgi:hypothetical protein